MNGTASSSTRSAFTLVELLVVVSVIALLLAMLLPSLRGARAQARAVVCGSNIRQLALANSGYAVENETRYCPGAIDMQTRNLHRWHGVRDRKSDAFDPARGPLTPFLTADKEIRACPSFRSFVTQGPAAFERGNGGYGYNLAYLGRVIDPVPQGSFIVKTDAVGALSDRVRRPGETILFTDAAFAGDAGLIEYSFAEPRFHPEYLRLGFRPDPSIHFRHRESANVAWCDGHVSRKKRTFTYRSGMYRSDPALEGIGWFGASDDNSLFDLR